MPSIKVGKYKVDITNKDKILFPKDKITKGDIIDYYQKIASTMLIYTKDRPLTMHRYPDGIEKEGFYHKDAPEYFPDWIKTKRIKKEDGSVNYVVANNEATLVYLANYGCLTPHLWLSKIDKLDYPDRIIFDFDPSKETDFDNVRKLALKMKDLIEKVGLTPYVMTTGSRGLHIYVPIIRKNTFDEVKQFAKDLGIYIVKNNQDIATMEVRKAKRGNRIFIDTLRNEFAQTGVAPYSVRAKNGAPVATPLTWKEIHDSNLTPQKYNINNIFARLAKIEDPFKNMSKDAKSIKSAQEKIKEILEN